MHVNASTQVQTANPLDALMADKTDKTAAQAAQEAFAAVLAKAGMNIQGSVAVGYQAPAALAPVLDKAPRSESKKDQPALQRETQGRTVPRARDDDKTVGQERTGEVRPDNKVDVRDDSRPADQVDEAKDDGQPAQQDGQPAKAADGGAPAKKAEDADQEKAAAGGDKAAVVAQAEENATAAMAGFTVQPVHEAPLPSMSGEGEVKPEIVANPLAEEGPQTVAQQAGGNAGGKVLGAAAQVQAVASQGAQQSEEAAPELVADLVQAVKAAVAEVKDESHGAGREAQPADPKRDEQAVQLARIIGGQGQVKIDVAPKAAATVSQPASTLTVNLVGAETQIQQAVQGQNTGFGGNGGFGNGMMQNNSGQQAAPTAQVGQANGAQMGAGVAALSQTGGFQASLAGIQAAVAGEGGQEIQGIQASSGAQAGSGAQNAQPGTGSAQIAQDLRQAASAQPAQKAGEVKLPIPAKQILDQVNVQIGKAAKDGLDKITVQMRPEALGRVEVHMKLGQDGQVSAHIVADRAETLEVLKKDSSQLEKSLNDAGFKTDSGSLQFSLRGEQQSQQQGAADQRAAHLFERGQALDEAEASETIVQSRPRAGSRSGVDISV